MSVDRRRFLRLAGLAAGSAFAPATASGRSLPWGPPSGAGRLLQPGPSSAAGSGAAFVDVSAARSGITWVHDNAMSPGRFLPETCGAGCAFLDYDNDGWMDLYLVNSGPSDFYAPKTPIRNALYKNNRDGTFTDVTEKAGVPGGTFGMGVAVGDYDNDGYPDLLVTAYGRCTLYKQQRQRHLHGRHEGGRPRRAGVDDERGLVRLRQRRPARPLPLQLRRVLRQGQHRLRRQQAGTPVLLHPARVQADAERALPQQRRRHVHPGQQGHRHRARARQGASAWSRPTSTTTA